MEFTLFYDILVILGMSIVAVYACDRLKIPPIVGFLISGVAAGPYGFGLVGSIHEVELLGEIGVILLLFVIGIEFSFKKLAKLKKNILLGGALQVFLTAAASLAAARLFGLALPTAIFFGMLFSLSSTAVVLSLLRQKGTIDTREGGLILGILIFQDIAVAPMMIFAPMIAGQADNPATDILILFAKAAGLVVGVIVFSRWIVPFVMRRIAAARIRELFMISIIFFCFGVVAVSGALGLSLALGAFIAGLIISESEYNAQAMSYVLPFKDVFTSIFFVSVGMLVDPAFIWNNLGVVLGLLALVAVAKTLTGTIAGLAVGASLQTALIAGISLFQVGEFSLILSKVGIKLDLVSGENYQYFLAVVVLSMAITPFVLNLAPVLAKRAAKLGIFKGKKTRPPDFERLTEHAIIVGFGINGRNLSKAAKIADIPYVIIEMNSETVRNEKAAGEPIFFGDAASEDILEHAGIERAKTIAIAIYDAAATRAIVKLAKRMNPGVYVIARTRFVGETEALFKLGADEVVPEEFETSIELFARMAAKFLVPSEEIEKFIAEIRADGYSALRGDPSGSLEEKRLKLHVPHFDIRVISVKSDSAIVGKSLAELDLRAKCGVTILAIKRDDKVTPNPNPKLPLEPGDLLIAYGEPENAARLGEAIKEIK